MSGTNTTPTTPSGMALSSVAQADTIKTLGLLFGIIDGNAQMIDVGLLGQIIIQNADIGAQVTAAQLANEAAQQALSDTQDLAAQIVQIKRSMVPLNVTPAMWCASMAMLPLSDSGIAGTSWNNSGVRTLSSAGAGAPDLVGGGLTNAGMNLFLDPLPVTDQLTAGTVWNNAGIPTVSRAGLGATSSYEGPLISDAVFALWMLGLPLAVSESGLPANISKLWINNAGTPVRTA
ncbi:hypothetical protein [Acetobacter indonesiensis]|uniref:hypothetical protein n=1 Tax=Acetobacter indonesiensis TaxID=104101 RepID=UPI0039EB65C8